MKRLIVGGLAALAIGLTGCSATGGAPSHGNTATGTVPVPTPADLRVEVLVTEKQCFGPDNCIYTYDATLLPTASFPPQPDGRTLFVVYAVTGGAQEQIGNFTVDNRDGHGDVRPDSPATAVAPHGAVVTATVTHVSAEGP